MSMSQEDYVDSYDKMNTKTSNDTSLVSEIFNINKYLVGDVIKVLILNFRHINLSRIKFYSESLQCSGGR